MPRNTWSPASYLRSYLDVAAWYLMRCHPPILAAKAVHAQQTLRLLVGGDGDSDRGADETAAASWGGHVLRTPANRRCEPHLWHLKHPHPLRTLPQLLRYFFWLALLVLSVGCKKKTMDTHLPVGGLSLHIVCRGDGRPAVILEAGLGNDSSVWSSVMPDIANTTEVCAYDRAGMGTSSKAPRPHSNQQMADELHALLQKAKIPPPYVIVAHSMGGANARFFAAKHPRAVAGIVLVDSVSEHIPSRHWPLLPKSDFSEFQKGLVELPEGIDFATYRDGLERLKTVSPSLGQLPLVVLTHGTALPAPPGANPALGKKLDAAWSSMQKDLARLSTNSAYLVVAGAGHYIQLDRPAAVVAAVNEVIESVRRRRPIDGRALSAKLH